MTDQPDFDSLDANGADTRDDFLDSEPIESGSRIKHPAGIGKPWHVCPDFLDPLKNNLLQTWHKPECDIRDIQELIYIGDGVLGWGSETVEAWSHASAWLDVHGLSGVRELLAHKFEKVYSESQAALEELRQLAARGDSAHSDVVINTFDLGVIVPFVEYLENLSVELIERFGPPKLPKTPHGEVDGGKKGRGRPPKKETPELADFAGPLVAEGWGWPKIRDEYIALHPKKAREYAEIKSGQTFENDHLRKLGDKIKNAYEGQQDRGNAR